MTRWKAGAGFLMTGLLVLGPVAPAMAAPAGGTARAAGLADDLRLDIDAMTPRVVTSTTPKLTVSGRITNVGDRRVDEVQVRLQRGEPVASDAQLRDLDDLDTDSATSQFIDVAESLERGDSVSFTVTAAVRGDVEQSLGVSRPGVYPTLVNVNGEPEYGNRERITAQMLPLPVLSVPGGPRAKPTPARSELTFLWPIMDTQPRRLPTTDGQVVLTDDNLASSLSVGGRLFGLVNSVSVAAGTTGTLLGSLCFAVDPDLLATVDAMSRGYKVRTEGGRTVAGTGADVAKEWLTRLRDLTRGQCVISVPYSDADLVALSRAGAVDLSNLAVGASTIVSQLLTPVKPAADLYWPAGGSFDQGTLVDLAAGGPVTVLADPGHLRTVRGTAPYQVTGLETTHPVRALPIDPLLSRTLTPEPRTGSLQDGLAALAFRTAFDRRAADQVIVAPPRRWNASVSELGTYLGLAQQLITGGFATPRSLSQATTTANGGTAVGLTYTPQDTVHEVPRSVTTAAFRINHTKRDLLKAMDDDPSTDVDPNELLSPMQYGLLRAVSTAWRGQPAQATAWVEAVDQQVAALSGQVVVTDPGRPLTLASGQSPIPVQVTNKLPVAIVVRIRLSASAGLRPVQFPDLRIPAASTRSAYIDAEVVRAGRFTVDASLTTPGGAKLGSTARLELTSTSYGVITVTITGVAGGVLVLLVVIRMVRRVRAARAGTAPTQDETQDEVRGDG